MSGYTVEQVEEAVHENLNWSAKVKPPMNDAVEGFGYIKRHFRDLERAVFSSNRRQFPSVMYYEASCLAAAAERFMLDCCSPAPDLVKNPP